MSEPYERLLRAAGYEYLFITGDSPVCATTKIQAIPRIAAHRMSLPLLASVLRNQQAAMMAKAKPAPVSAPETDKTLVSSTRAADQTPHNVE